MHHLIKKLVEKWSSGAFTFSIGQTIPSMQLLFQVETGKSSCTTQNINGATTFSKSAWCNYYYKLLGLVSKNTCKLKTQKETHLECG